MKLMPPLPDELSYLREAGTRPVHLGSGDVIRLLEHWGFTRNGREHLKKLKRMGLVRPVARKRGATRSLYETEAVLKLWEDV